MASRKQLELRRAKALKAVEAGEETVASAAERCEMTRKEFAQMRKDCGYTRDLRTAVRKKTKKRLVGGVK